MNSAGDHDAGARCGSACGSLVVGRLVALAASAAAGVFCVFFFAPDSDGTIAAHDPVMYAFQAEWSPRESINPQHPLFHILVLAATSVCRAAGAGHPGAVAVRIVAGLGAAGLVGLVIGLAGTRRWRFGLAAAGAMACTRMFVVEGASGENVLPAAAAALLVLYLADGGAGLWSVGAALVLALMLRQDNLLIVPPLIVLLAGRRSAASVARLVTVAGLVTLGLYVAIWAWLQPDAGGLARWLVRTGVECSVGGRPLVDIGCLIAYSCEVENAVAGWQWSNGVSPAHLALGLTWVALIGVAGWLARGRERDARFVAAVLVALPLRWLFYSWCEPLNPEWHLLTIVLLVAAAARSGRGAAISAVRARFGVLLLAVAIGIPAVCMWPTLLRLRESRVADSVSAAAQATSQPAVVWAHDQNVASACGLRGIAFESAYGDPNVVAEAFRERARGAVAPLILAADRFVDDGTPFALRRGAADRLAAMDAWDSAVGFRAVRFDGRTVALVADRGAAPATRAAGGK